jgi:hypothetical protein
MQDDNELYRTAKRYIEARIKDGKMSKDQAVKEAVLHSGWNKPESFWKRAANWSG